MSDSKKKKKKKSKKKHKSNRKQCVCTFPSDKKKPPSDMVRYDPKLYRYPGPVCVIDERVTKEILYQNNLFRMQKRHHKKKSSHKDKRKEVRDFLFND